ncbi:peptidylprolyl isomerase, FKBP-type [Nitrobacter hamburgensis X14]|uniref:Peptidyl-prolyl cis-trans isomerase n=2 Tax=Nitrobacter hamburgensis TaxID=912 RepID=Q1QHX0_NITHX|nr:peptidylprolyl isomerase [Nitrobacter hamburgensis]ABE64177.1 peptidylprolyl isomerase, FKBP-type [Nitrobacter hamburgensis X14]CAJ38530.1 nitrite oxidoreductase [Nitrobacter hamburgensis]
MVGDLATHDHDHEHDHEPAPAHFGAPERVSVGKYVTINYTLRTNGTIRHIRSAVWGDEPLEYQQGSGRLLPALERALEGKVAGERFEVILPPEEAYGERDKALQQRVPAETFGGVDQIEPGMCFLAHSDDERRVENVLVTEVDEDNGYVVVDTNHPLAGMTLEFEGSVVAVRDTPTPAGHVDPTMASMGDGLALAAAQATIDSRRKRTIDESPKPSTPGTVNDTGNA